MKEEKEEEVKFVPCSGCSAPVLPNLTECMFCGQKDPGKLAASSLGERFVNLRHALRLKWRDEAHEHEHEIRPNLDATATPLEKARYYLVSDDRAYPYVIIIITVLLYLTSLILGGDGLQRLGITGQEAISKAHIWTVFSALFLHGGGMHLLFNMVGLYYIAPTVMRVFGRSQFFLIYIISGLIGVITSILLGTPETVGASAAVAGLFGSLLFASYYEGTRSQMLLQQFFLYAVVMLLIGTLSPVVDNWAHVGGLFGGIIAPLFMMEYPRQRFETWVYDYAALAFLSASILTLVIAILVPL